MVGEVVAVPQTAQSARLLISAIDATDAATALPRAVVPFGLPTLDVRIERGKKL